jgi:serine/threonine protein kinase
MLKRTGHGKSVDWYLLGVLFYEMIVGVPPYFTNNKYILFLNKFKLETNYLKI